MCATSSAHGHHFCVADGRSNKIGTSDNFRLRVISLSCPWRPSLSSSLFYFLFSSLLHSLALLHSVSSPRRLPPLSLSCSSALRAAAHHLRYLPARRGEEEDGRSLFQNRSKYQRKKRIAYLAVARAHLPSYRFQLIASRRLRLALGRRAGSALSRVFARRYVHKYVPVTIIIERSRPRSVRERGYLGEDGQFSRERRE